MKVLISADDIKSRIVALADRIEHQYSPSEEIVLMPVLIGGLHFASDLSRVLKQPHQILPIIASSYLGGKEAQREFPRVQLLEGSVRDKHVLLVDDIRDRGRTLISIEKTLTWEQPKSIKSCVLLAKNVPTEFRPDFIGFYVDNVFVVGYGLDYRGRYRNLPYIAILEERE